jgi:hypothetical protein
MKISDKALELIIRDVLGGMEELATREGYRACLGEMEILGVEPATPQALDPAPPRHEAVVLAFPTLRKSA